VPRARLIRALPRSVTRPLSFVALAAWVVCMGVMIDRSYLQASSTNLATDLARYGTAAQWRGVYYRGEKIGFTVGQVLPLDSGFELQEDGRIQMSLLGATTAAVIRTTARVDQSFALQSFEFSLDPGTGPLSIRGRLDGLKLTLDITSAGNTRTETRDLKEAPAMMISLGRRLATEGLAAGTVHQWMVFDPATLQNSPVVVRVGNREVVTGGGLPIPAFKVEMTFAGLQSTAWITDTGEIVREESPMGLITVRESQDRATALAVSSAMQADMLEASAIVPVMRSRIDDPRNVERLTLRLDGADLSKLDLDGVGQKVDGNIIELTDPRRLEPGPADQDLARYLQAEAFIESDAPEIREAAERMVQGVTGTRARVERLTREVNAMLDKAPTMSLPSAREVLRTKVGDCNEHTVLFVAMARSLGIPARIDVGVAFVRGAFYYHAWPEVYIDEGKGRGMWLPVDPTFNQFPADTTHLRLARGGLDKQTVILPLIGRVKMTVLSMELSPNSVPIIVGRQAADATPLSIAIPQRQTCGCWVSPCAGFAR
jgi:transglutaminase-like putative cysteine protease